MNTWLILAVCVFLQSLILSLLLTPKARTFGRRIGMVDNPDLARKHHKRPTPRSGGIAIFISFWLVIIVNIFAAWLIVPGLGFLPDSVRTIAGNIGMRLPQLLGLFIGSTIIFVLGAMDDKKGLSPLLRLSIQVLACIPLIATGTVMKLMLPPIFGYVLTVLWVVLLTNSLNFLDNMNGLSSGVGAIIGFLLAVFAALSAEWYMLIIFSAFTASLIGFWYYNFPQASIFLGDSGSTNIGYLLAALTIITTWYEPGVPTQLPWLIPIVILGIPLFDTLSVMWIRFRAGKPLMVGDTNHLSHRLVALGMTRSEAVLFIYGATLTLGLLALPLRQVGWTYGVLHVVGILLIFFLLHWLERVSYRRTISTTSR